MSLPARIIALGSLVLIVALLLGLGLFMENARRAVRAEFESSAHLTLELLEEAAAFAGEAAGAGTRSDLVRRIGALQGTRHLCIGLYRRDGAALVEPEGCAVDGGGRAPAWFSALFTGEPVRLHKPLRLEDGTLGTVVVQADPRDEIEEVWRDVRDLAWLAAIVFVGANLLVFLMVGRALRPVSVLLAAIDSVARGDYALRLPRFSLVEFTRIAAGLRRMAATLERTRRENRMLALQSLRVQEQERRHIARELHDELGQSLVAIKTGAAYIARRGRVQAPELGRVAEEIIAQAGEVYGAVRALMQRLRPTTLDELGLEATLRQCIRDWSERHPATRCGFRVHGDMALGELAAISVYRIVQEALTNVAKHAAAGRVDIVLRRGAGEPGQLHLAIEDDGVGFDPDTTFPSLGLIGMRERAAALGGSLALRTRPGCGTRLTVRIPLQGGSRTGITPIAGGQAPAMGLWEGPAAGGCVPAARPRHGMQNDNASKPDNENQAGDDMRRSSADAGQCRAGPGAGAPGGGGGDRRDADSRPGRAPNADPGQRAGGGQRGGR